MPVQMCCRRLAIAICAYDWGRRRLATLDQVQSLKRINIFGIFLDIFFAMDIEQDCLQACLLLNARQLHRINHPVSPYNHSQERQRQSLG